MTYPLLTIDLSKITHNTRKIVEVSANLGIETIGVVKGCSGDPRVAKAMLAGGVAAIGDSRVSSLKRLRSGGVSDLVMLRQPLRNEVEEVVGLASVSLVSDYSVIPKLSRAAEAARVSHGVVLMVETGGLREGIMLEEVPEIAQKALGLNNIDLVGLGTNVGCLSPKGMGPAEEVGFLDGPRPSMQLELLVRAAERLSATIGRTPRIVSGGNSIVWKLLVSGQVPAIINQVRIGEAILLGRETLSRELVTGAFQDAFVLESEVIEVRDKPLVWDEGGGSEVKGSLMRRRAIVALGKQDIGAGMVLPVLPDLTVLGTTSDHLVVEVGRNDLGPINPGQVLKFLPNYQALAAAIISPFVQKAYLSESQGTDFELSNISSRKPVIE